MYIGQKEQLRDHNFNCLLDRERAQMSPNLVEHILIAEGKVFIPSPYRALRSKRLGTFKMTASILSMTRLLGRSVPECVKAKIVAGRKFRSISRLLPTLQWENLKNTNILPIDYFTTQYRINSNSLEEAMARKSI
jgi:hypothetical protein